MFLKLKLIGFEFKYKYHASLTFKTIITVDHQNRKKGKMPLNLKFRQLKNKSQLPEKGQYRYSNATSGFSSVVKLRLREKKEKNNPVQPFLYRDDEF